MTIDPTIRVLAILREAIDVPRDQRGTVLDRACGRDEVLRAEVEQLLATHDSCPWDFLETPEGFEDLAPKIVRKLK